MPPRVGDFWDMAGGHRAERPTGTFPGPSTAPPRSSEVVPLSLPPQGSLCPFCCQDDPVPQPGLRVSSQSPPPRELSSLDGPWSGLGHSADL